MLKKSWLCVLLGLFVAAGLVLSGCGGDDDDDDSSSGTTTNSTSSGSSGGATNAGSSTITGGDIKGNWTTPNDPDGSSRSFSLGDSNQATFFEDLNDPMSPGMQIVNGTWSLSGKTLTLNSSIPSMNGSGTVIGGNSVEINGRTYTLN